MPRRHEQVVSQLIGELVLDVFAQGTRLPAEQELAERLGTGRGTVHQALQALEERGMVELVAGSGAIVRPDDRWRLGEPDVLLAVLDAHRMPGLAAETIRTRTVLESDAAAFACEHATDGDLRLLADIVDGLQGAAAGAAGRAAALDDAFVLAERDFHHALALVGSNRVAASVCEPLHRVLAALRLRRAPDREAAVIAQHRRILEGVSSRDPELAISAVEAYGRLLARWVARRR
jgi:DNA-binding FadR family transcriptional regulator